MAHTEAEVVSEPRHILTDYLTEPDVARQLGVTPRTLREWRLKRTAPAHIRVGKTVLYPREGLQKWLKKLEAA